MIEELNDEINSGKIICLNSYVNAEIEWLAFQAADYIWLAYVNFFGQSGNLSQAIQLGKKVIHRGEGLIGERLKKYDWKFFHEINSVVLYQSTCVASAFNNNLNELYSDRVNL